MRDRERPAASAHRELRASEERYRALFEESRDAICIGTIDGQLLDVNPAAVKLFGYSNKQELLEKNIGRDLYWNSEDRRRTEALFREQGFVEDHEVALKTRSGQRIRVQETASAIHDDDGEVIGFRGILRDVTDQRRLEHQLRQSQKMEAVGRLANGVAHDFNNLLTAINGYSELLLARMAADDPQRRGLEEIRKAGRRAADITRRLLTLSRHQNVSPRRLDLNRTVTDMEKLLKRVIGEDIELRSHLDFDLQPIHADLSQIEQIILNLVINARDAMPEGGQLIVETHSVHVPDERPPDERPPRDLEPGGYAQLVFTDSGEGMSREVLEHAFEPFFTTKDRRHNTGLGLAIVYGIVKQGGGHVEVESSAGTGTSFRLYLPLFVEGETEIVRDSGAVAMPRGNELVLLVEDESPVRELVKQILNLQGYRVAEAADAEAALAQCEELTAAPDVLLSDVIMPGMSGIELAEDLKKRYPDMEILFMSGYTDSHAEIRRLARQGAAFLPKPFTPQELSRKIRDVLDTRARRS